MWVQNVKDCLAVSVGLCLVFRFFERWLMPLFKTRKIQGNCPLFQNRQNLGLYKTTKIVKYLKYAFCAMPNVHCRIRKNSCNMESKSIKLVKLYIIKDTLGCIIILKQDNCGRKNLFIQNGKKCECFYPQL